MLKLRPHHGMCLAFFEGKGYSDGFTAHMAEIKEKLEKDPDQLISLTSDADDICAACPNNMDGICRTQEKVSRYDNMVRSICEPEKNNAAGRADTGSTALAFREFEEKVRKHILDDGRREEICGDCQWNLICRQANERRLS